jgi:hypothetical protein
LLQESVSENDLKQIVKGYFDKWFNLVSEFKNVFLFQILYSFYNYIFNYRFLLVIDVLRRVHFRIIIIFEARLYNKLNVRRMLRNRGNQNILCEYYKITKFLGGRNVLSSTRSYPS